MDEKLQGLKAEAHKDLERDIMVSAPRHQMTTLPFALRWGLGLAMAVVFGVGTFLEWRLEKSQDAYLKSHPTLSRCQ